MWQLSGKVAGSKDELFCCSTLGIDKGALIFDPQAAGFDIDKEVNKFQMFMTAAEQDVKRAMNEPEADVSGANKLSNKGWKHLEQAVKNNGGHFLTKTTLGAEFDHFMKANPEQHALYKTKVRPYCKVDNAG